MAVAGKLRVGERVDFVVADVALGDVGEADVRRGRVVDEDGRVGGREERGIVDGMEGCGVTERRRRLERRRAVVLMLVCTHLMVPDWPASAPGGGTRRVPVVSSICV